MPSSSAAAARWKAPGLTWPTSCSASAALRRGEVTAGGRAVRSCWCGLAAGPAERCKGTGRRPEAGPRRSSSSRAPAAALLHLLLQDADAVLQGGHLAGCGGVMGEGSRSACSRRAGGQATAARSRCRPGLPVPPCPCPPTRAHLGSHHGQQAVRLAQAGGHRVGLQVGVVDGGAAPQVVQELHLRQPREVLGGDTVEWKAGDGAGGVPRGGVSSAVPTPGAPEERQA